jgi:nitroreductase
MRWLTDEPVPDEMVRTVLWAATRAPSPGNTQQYGFVVVSDREKLRVIGEAVARALAPLRSRPRPDDPSQRAMIEGTLHLADHLATVPRLIVVGGPVSYPARRPDERYLWSAIYPAVQNLLLAARSLGLGATLTTWHLVAETTIREQLAIPDDVVLGAVIPLGWPARPFGEVRRRPLEDVVHTEVW